MGSFWKALGRIFKPAADPAQAALERKIEMNRRQGQLALAVKRQDRFLRDYLAQAVEAKRTGDGTTLRSIKGMIVRTMAMRKQAQRMLNAARLMATRADQMESYRDFIEIMTEASHAMAGQGITTGQVVQMQQDLAIGLQKTQNASEVIDQALGALDATLGGMAEQDAESVGITDSALDEMIAKLAGEKDTAAERRIEELLAKM